jgi:hypothetical protein
LRIVIWPEASNAQNNIAAVSAEGSTVNIRIEPPACRSGSGPLVPVIDAILDADSRSGDLDGRDHAHLAQTTKDRPGYRHSPRAVTNFRAWLVEHSMLIRLVDISVISALVVPRAAYPDCPV